jgi:hypothetical protein
MKKTFIDMNLVNRLKEVDLEKLEFKVVLDIKDHIDKMIQESKSFSTVSSKTVFEWLRCSVDLLVTRQ